MTREEALENLKGLLESNYVDSFEDAENEALEMAIKALEQSNYNSIKSELNGDMISRQAVCKIIDDIRDCISVTGYWAFLERLKKLPAVDPTKTGHWKRASMDRYTTHAQYWYKCDKCGELNLGNTDFCPNCGTKMVEPQEKESEG